MSSGWKLVANPSGTNTFAEICAANNLPYSHGCGCYELTKSEKISSSKFLVAMNEDTGEIVEGAEAVRSKLNLGSGDINVGKKNIPKPWTLYVNSTSPNRGVPAGCTVLIRTDGDATSGSKQAAAAKKPSSSKTSTTAKGATKKLLGKDDDDDDDDNDGEEEDDDEDEDEEETERKQEFLRKYPPLADAALAAFLKHTRYFAIPKRKGNGVWHIRMGNPEIYRFYEEREDWPNAFVGCERQPISAAFFDITKENPQQVRLAGIWTFSPTGDETSMFYYKGFDDYDFLENLVDDSVALEGLGITTHDAEDAFSVSSGDYPVAKFNCPALDRLLPLSVIRGEEAPPASSPAGNTAAAATNEGWKLVANPSGTNTFAEICAANNLPYSHGCGCYELTKSEKISSSKFLVAMNEDTGEIVEGAEAVRSKLNLGSGDINVGKKNIPKPWTLYVNSTSPNRGVPAGCTVLIRTGPAGGSTSSTSSSVPVTDPNAYYNNFASAEPNAPTSVLDAFRKFATDHCPHATTALQRFLKLSQVFEIDGDPGTGNKFIARGARLSLVQDSFDSYEGWPWIFAAGKNMPVFAAVWKDKRGGNAKEPLELVAVFVSDVMSPGADTALYFVSTFDEADKCVLEDLQEGEGGCFGDLMGFEEDTSDAFGVTQGEEAVPHALFCPALQCVPRTVVVKKTKRPREDEE